MQENVAARILTRLGTATARPGAFGILIAYAVLWVFIQPDTLDWHGVATLMTWGMTLMIQRSEHRDTQAIQAKLDELLRVMGDADEGLRTIDKREPEEIERVRERGAKPAKRK